MKRYSLDKAAPGMFEAPTGGWVKYTEACALLDEHGGVVIEKNADGVITRVVRKNAAGDVVYTYGESKL